MIELRDAPPGMVNVMSSCSAPPLNAMIECVPTPQLPIAVGAEPLPDNSPLTLSFHAVTAKTPFAPMDMDIATNATHNPDASARSRPITPSLQDETPLRLRMPVDLN